MPVLCLLLELSQQFSGCAAVFFCGEFLVYVLRQYGVQHSECLPLLVQGDAADVQDYLFLCFHVPQPGGYFFLEL